MTKLLCRRRAFTLIEIMMVVALTGIIVTLAIVPVTLAIRHVVETETTYSDETALRRTISFMAQDVAAGLRLAPVVLQVINRERMGGDDEDILIVASAAPAKQNLAAGSIVYKLVQKGFMNSQYIPGLYRWLLPGIVPEDVESDKLSEKDGQLVLPYVTGMDVSVFEAPDWVIEYAGKLPVGVKFLLTREEEGKDDEERVEYIYSFPR